MILLVLLVAFGASVVGAVCGIGGGVIMKPLLDALNITNVAEISFLSGCTVLSMSCYSVGKAALAKDSLVQVKTGTPLAIGAALGGVVGKQLFSALQAMSVQPQRVGGYQAVCLSAVTLATLLYTLNKKKIRTLHISNALFCVGAGLVMGFLSSFLGIGGGPINLVVLHYFFSMETKEAAQNSLYCILISQIASLITSLATASVPPFHVSWLVVMVLGGIAGGMAGRKLNQRLRAEQVDVLFVILIAVIIGISYYNAWRFL